MAVAVLAGSSVLFGASALFAKLSFDYGTGVLTLLAARYLGGALLLVPLAAWRAPSAWRSPGRWGWLLTGLFNLGSTGFYMAALSYDKVGRVAPIVFMFPALVAGIGWLLFRTPVARRLIVALVIGVTGTMLVLGEGIGTPSKLLAGVLAVACAFTAASYFVFAARFSAAGWIPALATIFGLGTLVYVPAAAATGSGLPHGRGWLWLGLLVLLGTIAPYLMQVSAISAIGSAKAGVMAMIEPMVAVLLAVLVLGESMGALQAAGAALVLIAFAVAQLPARRRLGARSRA